MKTQVRYYVEWSEDGVDWIRQIHSEKLTDSSARKELAEWKREEPGERLRLVRVTTTEEREVVG